MAKKRHLTLALFYPDTTIFLTPSDNNDGPKIQRNLASLSHELDMMGWLHTDICAQDMLSGVDIKVKLEPYTDLFKLIVHNITGGYKSIKTYATPLVHKIKLNPAISQASEKILQKSNDMYMLKCVVLKTCSIPTGLLNVVTFNSAYKANPFVFKHLEWPIWAWTLMVDTSQKTL